MMRVLKWQRMRWFWRTRHRLSQVVFAASKFAFMQKERAKHARDDVSIAAHILKSLTPYLLLTIMIVIALELLENAIARMPVEKWVFAKNALVWLTSVRQGIAFSRDSLTALLSITASVSGVFLGLYFTAISVVAGSVFARVPAAIRALLLNEKVGNQYIKVLAMLTTISMLLLGYSAYGGTPGSFITFFVVALGCFGVLGFLILGRRAFHFFDPASLSDALFYDLRDNVKQATIHGFRWRDPNFQAHYQKLAGSNISTLKALIDLCMQDEKPETTPLSAILQNTARFLLYYSRMRSLIPSESRWYTLVPRYKSFFLQDSSSLDLALKTYTSIQPQMIPERYWLENRLAEIVANSLGKLIEEENLDVVYDFFPFLQMYLENQGSNLEIRKGYEFIKSLGVALEKHFETESLSKSDCSEMQLALFDYYGLITMSMVLGFCRPLVDKRLRAILLEAADANWLTARAIYRNGIPPNLLSRMEYVRKGIQFENAVEKTTVSPKWYSRQLVITQCLELLKQTAEDILFCTEDFYVEKSRKLLEKKSYVMTANHCLRGMEMCSKLSAHFPALQELVSELEKLAVCKDIALPKWDWESIKSKIDNSHDRLIKNLAECMASIALMEQKENIPDLFGRSYSTVCQECYNSLLNKKTEIFVSLFQSLFAASLKAHEKLRVQVRHLEPTSGLVITLEPLMDLMNLSGYALLYSDLFNISQIWQTCQRTWDTYLNDHQNASEVVKFLLASHEMRSHLFQISPRDILRTEWQLHFHSQLRQMGLLERSAPWEDKRVAHDSPLIRALCRSGFEPHIAPAEVFILMYLLNRPEASGIEFEDRWQLAKSFQEEKKRE